MSSRSRTEPEVSVPGRNLSIPTYSSHPENVNKWALIVGISKYKYESLNLKYAHNDAEEFYKLIQDPSCGNFKADNIKKLIDEEATTSNITRALRSFLKNPDEEDLVIIYLACHGAPDPARLRNISFCNARHRA